MAEAGPGVERAANQPALRKPDLPRKELPPLSEIDIARVEKAARDAGEIIREHHAQRREKSVEFKSERQVVTDADTASQKILKDALLSVHECSFLGEEKDPEDQRVTQEAELSGDQWVVDPLDGTENMNGFPPSLGISIGLMRDGKAVLGVIYDPINDVMYSAREGDDGIKVVEKGQERILKVSETENPTQAIVGLDFSSNMETRRQTLAAQAKVIETARAIKVVGAPVLSLAAVAAGDLELFYRPTTKLPDVIAGIALVKAAGGKIVNATGEDWKVGDKEIIAGSPKMVDAYQHCFTNESNHEVPEQDAQHEKPPAGIYSPSQAAALYEWLHLLSGGRGISDPWPNVEADFRENDYIKELGEWQMKLLTEDEFWRLVFFQSSKSTSALYEGQNSRLLRSIAEKFVSLGPETIAASEYLLQTQMQNHLRLPTATEYETPVILRQTVGDSEQAEGGSFYIQDGNRRLLNYAAQLLRQGRQYVPILALIGSQAEGENAYSTELQSKGPIAIEGYKGREPISQADLLNNFRYAEQLYFTIPSKIGDAVVATGFLRGIIELEKSLSLPTKEKIIVAPPSMHNLLRPTCEALGIRLMKGGDINASQNRAEYQARDIENKKAVIFELDSTGGGNPEGLYFGNEQLTIKNILPTFLNRYGIAEAGPNRQRQYIADLFGIDASELDPRRCQPGLVMPDTDAATRLVEKYGIDTSKPQIAINIETGEAGRQYSIDNWCEVIRLIKRNYPEAEFNIVYDANKQPDNETYVDREGMLAAFQTVAAEDGAPSQVRLLGDPLSDIVPFMETQTVFLSNDTGLSHLVATASAKDMPYVVTLFAAPDVDPDQWITSPRMKPVIPPLTGTLDPRGGIYCEDPALKWINHILPESVAGNALAVMYS